MNFLVIQKINRIARIVAKNGMGDLVNLATNTMHTLALKLK